MKAVSAELDLRSARVAVARRRATPTRERLPRADAVVSRALADPTRWVPLGARYLAPRRHALRDARPRGRRTRALGAPRRDLRPDARGRRSVRAAALALRARDRALARPLIRGAGLFHVEHRRGAAHVTSRSMSDVTLARLLLGDDARPRRNGPASARGCGPARRRRRPWLVVGTASCAEPRARERGRMRPGGRAALPSLAARRVLRRRRRALPPQLRAATRSGVAAALRAVERPAGRARPAARGRPGTFGPLPSRALGQSGARGRTEPSPSTAVTARDSRALAERAHESGARARLAGRSGATASLQLGTPNALAVTASARASRACLVAATSDARGARRKRRGSPQARAGATNASAGSAPPRRAFEPRSRLGTAPPSRRAATSAASPSGTARGAARVRGARSDARADALGAPAGAGVAAAEHVPSGGRRCARRAARGRRRGLPRGE